MVLYPASETTGSIRYITLTDATISLNIKLASRIASHNHFEKKFPSHPELNQKRIFYRTPITIFAQRSFREKLEGLLLPLVPAIFRIANIARFASTYVNH